MVADERSFHDFHRDEDAPDSCRICGQADRAAIHTSQRFEPPRIPLGWTPPQDQRPAPVEAFTFDDALTWLGVSREAYERAKRAGQGLGCGPLDRAILDARAANSSEPQHGRSGVEFGITTAADILARHGVDPLRPELAVAAEIKARSRFWS